MAIFMGPFTHIESPCPSQFLSLYKRLLTQLFQILWAVNIFCLLLPPPPAPINLERSRGELVVTGEHGSSSSKIEGG